VRRDRCPASYTRPRTSVNGAGFTGRADAPILEGMRPVPALAVPVLVFALLSPASPQIQIGPGSGANYEYQYGPPVAADLTDVANGIFNRRVVTVEGRLDILDYRGHLYKLRDQGVEILLLPVPDVADEVRQLAGRPVQVTGLVREVPERQSIDSAMDPQLPRLPSREGNFMFPQISITVWSGVDATDFAKLKEDSARSLTLEGLVTGKGRKENEPVRVVGKFRGKNLFGDLPSKSQRRSDDWVIKDDVFAVWITGKKPKGSGWSLDPGLKRDTGKWIEVVGRAVTRDGVVYVQAAKVSLTTAPTPTAEAAPPPPPPERPKRPPVVVFALPLDGDVEVPGDSRFVVQFSKDMDESTFEGRVQLRYTGPRLPGDREFDGLKLSYDRGRRALTVDPGDVLRPRRQIELMLLPGIQDVDGLLLVPRRGKDFVEGAEVLHFQSAS
jgi:hypothetical protein